MREALDNLPPFTLLTAAVCCGEQTGLSAGWAEERKRGGAIYSWDFPLTLPCPHRAHGLSGFETALQ